LVNVAGNYTAITLHTENATVWSENFSSGCMNTGYIPNPVIQPDGLIVSKRLYWGTGNSAWGGDFGGRVEPGAEPMQWVASAGDVEMKGTWRRGQLSGEFIRRFVHKGQQIECRGKVSGYKTGK
jgi:hypothetical protein